MQYSRHASPGFFQGSSHVDASRGVFNQIGRDQNNYNSYNYGVNDEIVADAYLDKLPRALRAGYSAGNHKPCLAGTRKAVLLDIEVWEADKTNESVYWLKGVAGCGKSTVAQTFAERSVAKGNLGASFFCSRDYPDRRNLRLIFLTLAYDLAYWSADFKSALVPIVRANPNVQYDSLPMQLEKLIVRPFKKSGLSATIAVDALDECEDKEPVSEFISALALHVDSIPTVKFFITGRPEDRIRNGFKLPSLRTKELPLHDVDSDSLNSDIKSFLQTRLGEIARRRSQSISGRWPLDEDLTTVLKKTSGLFIIASVIIRFIDYPHASPQERLKLIVDLPNSTIYEGKTGIDVIYHQVFSASFENVFADDHDFLDQLRLVIGSIVLAFKPLPRASVAKILEMTPERIWTILTHLHSVLIVPESESEPIRILHKSFADFITDEKRCPDGRFRIDTPAHHSKLGIHCLKLMELRLMRNICCLPRYAMNDGVEDLHARRNRYIGAPLSYACSSWAKHLQLSFNASDDTGIVVKLVSHFFRHHLLSWLEVLSIEEIFHVAIYSFHDVRSWLMDVKSPDTGLLDLIDDCKRFVLRSFDGIEQSAMHIYHSALSWTPTSSLIRTLYAAELTTETKLANAVGTAWDACVRIISVGETTKAFVFSHKGTLIAAQCEVGLFRWSRVKVFDAVTGVNRAIFDNNRFAYSVAFSPDDAFLASGLQDGNINVWELQTGTLFQTFETHRIWNIYSVAFSPCGTMIASGESNGTTRIWNLSSGGCDHVFGGHSGPVTHICWLPEKRVILGSNDRTVRIWDVGHKTSSNFFAEYPDRVIAVASSPGSFLVASANGAVKIYDSQSGDTIQAISSKGLTHSRLSINGDKIFLASRNSGSLWDLTSKTRVSGIDYNGDHATFSPNGTSVASIYGKFLKIWKTNIESRHHEDSTCPHNELINDVYVSPDERLVACKSKKGIEFLDATLWLSLVTIDHPDITSIVFSPDSRYVAVQSRTEAQIFDAATWLVTLTHPDITSIMFSPDSRYVAVQSRMETQIFDVATWLSLFTVTRLSTQISNTTTRLSLFTFANTDVVSIDFPPNSVSVPCVLRYYATERRDFEIYRRVQKRTIEVDSGVISIEFSPGSALVTCLSRYHNSSDYEEYRHVQTWNVHTGHLVKSIKVDNNTLHIALSPDGSQLASLSRSHIELWDLESKRCLARLTFKHPLWETAKISFAINGTSITLQTTDGTRSSSWRIFSKCSVDETGNFIKNSDGTKSWLVLRSRIFPMVLIPIMEERPNRVGSALYRCDRDGSWINMTGVYFGYRRTRDLGRAAAVTVGKWP